MQRTPDLDRARPEHRRTRRADPAFYLLIMYAESGRKDRQARRRRLVVVFFPRFPDIFQMNEARAPSRVTDLLIDWSRGDRAALDQLLPRVFGELQQAARRELRRTPAGHTLQPNALVNELYLRLVEQRRASRNWMPRRLGSSSSVSFPASPWRRLRTF
jgi:ECF sigma factor